MIRPSHRIRLAGLSLLRATLFVLLFALAANVGAQDDGSVDRVEILAALAPAGFDDETHQGILDLFEQAGENAISPELLLPRLQEGVSKGVGGAQLTAALTEEIGYLTTARDVIRDLEGGVVILTDLSNLSRAANFLRSGRNEDELLRVAKASVTSPDSFRPATLLYLSMANWGIDQNITISLVEAVVASGLDPEAYPEITGLLSDAQRARMDVSETARRIGEQLQDGRSLRQIARTLRR